MSTYRFSSAVVSTTDKNKPAIFSIFVLSLSKSDWTAFEFTYWGGLTYVNQNPIGQMHIPCRRCQFDSIPIKCTFELDKCARVDTTFVIYHISGSCSWLELQSMHSQSFPCCNHDITYGFIHFSYNCSNVVSLHTRLCPDLCTITCAFPHVPSA